VLRCSKFAGSRTLVVIPDHRRRFFYNLIHAAAALSRACHQLDDSAAAA